MPRFAIGWLVCLLAIGACAAIAEEPADGDAEKELQRVQGTWEFQVRDAQGQLRRRLVRSIAGHRETVTHFDPNGMVLHSHTADISVARAGDVRVFTYRNLQVTAGPRAGAVQEQVGRYAYRVEADDFYEIQGLLIGQEKQPLAVVRWKRVPERQG